MSFRSESPVSSAAFVGIDFIQAGYEHSGYLQALSDPFVSKGRQGSPEAFRDDVHPRCLHRMEFGRYLREQAVHQRQ